MSYQHRVENESLRHKLNAALKRAEEAEALNNHLELAVRSAEGVSDALRRKLEAAEAKLAEYEKPESLPTKLKYSSVLPKSIGGTDEVESYHCMIHGNTPERKKMEEAYADAKQMCGDLFTGPAPAVSLAELVPQRKPISMDAPISAEWAARTSGYRNGFNDCVDEILRNIEESK